MPSQNVVEINEGGYECFQQLDLLLRVAIQPSHSSDPLAAVKKQMNEILFVYDENIEGVPLSYSELKLAKGHEYGRFITDQFWVHLDVNIKVLAFKPEIGSVIEGRIIRSSEYGLSLLVLSLFNASISDDILRKAECRYDSSSNYWSKGVEELKEGDVLRFKVSTFEHSGGVISLAGII